MSVEEFINKLKPSVVIDVSGMSQQEILDFYVQRQAALRNGENPDDPTVAERYKP